MKIGYSRILRGTLKSKRGGTMVEAAVVFPLIICTVMVVIYILIFLNEQVNVQTKMHMNLWAERGTVTKTVKTSHKVKEKFPVYEQTAGVKKLLYYDGTLKFAKRGILTKTFSRELKGYVHAVREMEFIRKVDLVL